jgi:hypothetical protein
LKLGLNTRNAVAVAAGDVGPVKTELEGWIRVIDKK